MKPAVKPSATHPGMLNGSAGGASGGAIAFPTFKALAKTGAGNELLPMAVQDLAGGAGGFASSTPARRKHQRYSSRRSGCGTALAVGAILERFSGSESPRLAKTPWAVAPASAASKSVVLV